MAQLKLLKMTCSEDFFFFFYIIPLCHINFIMFIGCVFLGHLPLLHVIDSVHPWSHASRSKRRNSVLHHTWFWEAERVRGNVTWFRERNWWGSGRRDVRGLCFLSHCSLRSGWMLRLRSFSRMVWGLVLWSRSAATILSTTTFTGTRWQCVEFTSACFHKLLYKFHCSWEFCCVWFYELLIM